MIPKPRFLQKRIEEVAIGTFKEIATVQEMATVHDALSIFVERRVSALPVVNEQGVCLCMCVCVHSVTQCSYVKGGEWIVKLEPCNTTCNV